MQYLWIQNQNIQFMCFTREVSIVKDLSKFLPWNTYNNNTKNNNIDNISSINDLIILT